MLQLLSGSLIESGVDYITVTCREPDSIEKARNLAIQMAVYEDASGMLGSPWSANGYEGYKCGSVVFGERADGCMVRAGGNLAALNWWKLYAVADNVTRLDLQATFRTGELPGAVVHRHYLELQRANRKMKRGPVVSRTTNSKGGYTAYTGSRTSDVFGRIYNKEAQAKLDHYKSCVRYEVQFNKARARKVAHGVNRNFLGEKQMAAEVLSFFARRQVKVKPLQEAIGSLSTIVDTSLPRRLSDLDKRFAWLRGAVRPTVEMMIDRGLSNELMEALGL